MGFIFIDTAATGAAAASVGGLAADTAGTAGQASTAGAVTPPGLEEVSASNVARIVAYVTDTVQKLGMAAGFQDIYGSTVAASAAGYELTDALSATALSA